MNIWNTKQDKMENNIIKRLLFFLTILYLTACSSFEALTPKTVQLKTTIVPTQDSNFLQMPPMEMIIPTIMSTPTTAPTVIIPKMTTQCVNIVKKHPSEMGVDASYRIVLIGYHNMDAFKTIGPASDSYLFDPNSNEKIIIKNKTDNTWLDMYSTSPNGSFFQYFVNTQIHREMFLLKPDGTIIPGQLSQKIGKYFYNPIGWTGDQKVLIEKKSTEATFGLLSYDPETNEKEEVSLYFPRANLDSSMAYFSFCPLMDRVAYLDTNYNLILYDLRAGKEIKSVNKILGMEFLPSWSRDGEYLVFPKPGIKDGEYELFSINKLGEEHRLTYLTDTHKKVGVSKYSWSPDSIHLAVSLYTDPDSLPDSLEFGEYQSRVAVINVQSGEIINYCIKAPIGTISWSPDGKLLLINKIMKDIPTGLLVNLETKEAVELGTNMIAAGWLKVNATLADSISK